MVPSYMHCNNFVRSIGASFSAIRHLPSNFMLYHVLLLLTSLTTNYSAYMDIIPIFTPDTHQKFKGYFSALFEGYFYSFFRCGEEERNMDNLFIAS